MSCYYTFYLLKRTEKSTETHLPIYDYAGAYCKNIKDGEESYRAIPLECRSRSFIHGDTFREWEYFDKGQLSKQAQLAIFGKEYSKEEDFTGLSLTFCPFNPTCFEYNAELITRGYVTLEDFDMIVASNYDLYYIEYEAEIKKAEYVAALPDEERRNYVPIAFLNRNSDSYIYETIRQAADMLGVFPEMSAVHEDYIILCSIG